jgi:pseudouridine-5'-phosphate glycosidase
VAERDIGVAVGLGWPVGCTTVSASLALAAAAGVAVFATGGIGGVHRGAGDNGDVSADLDALARHRLVTVSAGAKAFLDLGRTLEDLETRGVPVLGFATDDFPAFYSRSSGLRVPHRVDSAAEVAAVSVARWSLGGGGLLVANPIPESDELAGQAEAVASALHDAARAGVSGAAVTPFVLARIAEATGGRSVPANLALAEHNAAVAAAIAVELDRRPSTDDGTGPGGHGGH